METTTITFCSHIMRNLIDNTFVFNAISIQMLSHCDLITFIVFVCSSVHLLLQLKGAEFHSKHQRNLGKDDSER